MKINKHYKLEKVVSKDGLRRTLQKIFLDEKCAVATDGFIMAVVPIEMEETDEKKIMIDPDVLKSVRGFVHKDAHEIELEINDVKAITPQKISFPLQLNLLPDDQVYPDYKSIIPEGNPVYSFSLDIKNLNRLCGAFGCTKVILGYYSDKKPVRIIPMSLTAKEVGYIMPYKGEKLENEEVKTN